MSDEQPPPPQLPRLPVRASIYIDPDGSVHFGALFEELLPVAAALGADKRAHDLLVDPPADEAKEGRSD